MLIENFIKFQKKIFDLKKTLIFVSINKCANNILRSQQLGTEQKNKGEIIMQKNMTVLANKFCDDVFEMCLKKCKSLEIESCAEKLVQENYAQLRQYPDIFFNSIKAIFVNSKFSRHQRKVLVAAVKTVAIRTNTKLQYNSSMQSIRKIRKISKSNSIRTVIYSAA